MGGVSSPVCVSATPGSSCGKCVALQAAPHLTSTSCTAAIPVSGPERRGSRLVWRHHVMHVAVIPHMFSELRYNYNNCKHPLTVAIIASKTTHWSYQSSPTSYVVGWGTPGLWISLYTWSWICLHYVKHSFVSTLIVQVVQRLVLPSPDSQM